MHRSTDIHLQVLGRHGRYPPDLRPDSQTHSEESRARYIECWDRWCDEAPPDETLPRIQAVAILKDCLERNALELDLMGLGLTELPRFLPDGITRLSVAGNRLSALPTTLPDTLCDLEANDNRLERLPDHLPEALRDLELSGNRLTSLPAALPVELEILTVANNALAVLPDSLPVGLRSLCVAGNHLTALPNDLPRGLLSLRVTRNELTALPERLPECLRWLHCERNRLTMLPTLPSTLQMLLAQNNEIASLPQPLPSGLRELVAHHNRLTSLPERLPPLRELDVGHNRLSTLPDSVLQLPNSARIDIQANAFSEATIRPLIRIANNMNAYDGPNLSFSIPVDHFPEPIVALQYVVAEVLGQNSQEQSTRAKWTSIACEPHASEFGVFLHRLTATVNAKVPTFKEWLAHWLTRLADTPALRRQTFLIAQDATETCEDRVTLTFNEMQTAVLAHRVDEGEYDDNAAALVRAGRQMFRLESLARIARDKVRGCRVVDEIEVFLSYQTRLRDSLELDVIAPRMRYADASGVDEDDLREALRNVHEREAGQFADWLTLWKPWQDMVQRTAPACLEAMAPAWREEREEEHARRVRDRLADAGLDNDAGARIIVGKQVADEMEKESAWALTKAFFVERFACSPAADSAVQCLETVEALAEIASMAPALACFALSARDVRGEHLGSRVAEIVSQGMASPLADAYLSMLRVLRAQGSIGADELLEMVLPREDRDPVRSIAHAMTGAAWSSRASTTFCSLLTELASEPSAAQRIVERLSFEQNCLHLKRVRLSGEMDFFDRAERADVFTSNPSAVALLLRHDLVPTERALSRRPTSSDARPIAPPKDLTSLLRRIRSEIRPRLSVPIERIQREKKELEDVAQARAQIYKRLKNERQERNRDRTAA